MQYYYRHQDQWDDFDLANKCADPFEQFEFGDLLSNFVEIHGLSEVDHYQVLASKGMDHKEITGYSLKRIKMLFYLSKIASPKLISLVHEMKLVVNLDTNEYLYSSVYSKYVQLANNQNENVFVANLRTYLAS